MLLSNSSLAYEFCLTGKRKIFVEEFLSLVHAVCQTIAQKGPRLVLAFEDSYFFTAAVFGSLAMAKTVVLLPNNKSGTLESYRNEYDAILSDETLQNLTPSAPREEFKISESAELVFFTSGSQGEPKKVVKAFSHFLAEVAELEKTFSDNVANSLFLSTAVHQHIYGFLFKILWPLTTKKTWQTQLIEYPEQLESQTVPFTLISTPAFLKRIPEGEKHISFCRAVFSSGGPLNFAAAQNTLRAVGVTPIEVFGSTESGGIAYRQCDDENTLWTPFSVLSLSTDENSQLIVKSPYFKEASLTLSDRVQFLKNGFTLLGRNDDVVKIEEKRVSLSEIENKLRSFPLVNDAVAVAFEDAGRQQLGCLVVLSDSGKALLNQSDSRTISNVLREHLRAHFESIVLPRRFRFVSQLPYNERAKLTKKDLLETLLSEQ